MEIKHESFNKILHKDYGDAFIRMINSRNFKYLLEEIESISELSEDYGYQDLNIEDDTRPAKNKFIGDLFEIFAECFFLLNSSDNRIGVHEYNPVMSDDDNGVDGFGKNIDGLPCTIQVKYRSNPTYKLKERDIKQFPYQSIINYDVDWKRNGSMLVFTNCDGLHWYTESKVFNSKIRVINGSTISSMIDNNEGFWSGFKSIVETTIKNKGVDKLYEIFKSKL